MVLRLTQKPCQRRDVQLAEAKSGRARCDLLEQPGVAIRVAERRKGKVRPTEPGAASGWNWARSFEAWNNSPNLDTAGNGIFAGSFDIGNDPVEKRRCAA
jgi:hypothetical protein